VAAAWAATLSITQVAQAAEVVELVLLARLGAETLAAMVATLPSRVPLKEKV
jgi:hypothetical protein